MTQVIKRDGTEEPFEKHKLVRVVRAAGLSEQQAHDLAEIIAGWIHEFHSQSVSSLLIRDKTLIEMRKIHLPAAQLYEWYQQTKEIPSSG